MKKMLNMFFYVLKHLLLIIAFVSTLYIIVYMYRRLNKDLKESIEVFLPYVAIFVLFCINLIARQKGITKNMFYNICCCLVFATICYCGYRAIFDHNMIMNQEMEYNINFNYYSDFMSPMKIMLYGLCVGNLCFMFLPSQKTVQTIQELEKDDAKEQKLVSKRRKDDLKNK